MRLARGPRPLAIRVFVAAFLAAATIRLGQGLADVELAALGLARRAPWLAWNHDTTIVALSAEFTIALIPIAWIYLYAARFARWLVLVFGTFRLWAAWPGVLLALRAGSIAPLHWAEPALLLAAMVSLVTPGARRWFAKARELGPEIFE
ncbi:MAG: hypothetical protein GC147_12545 [Porphyrobacter sp.]|nr:hypothetical protein [Porphyrobacter sp.]